MNNVNDIISGMKVKVLSLNSTSGMTIKQEYLDRRQKGKTGKVLSWVPGHGGDVWFVEQDNGVAAYTYLEIDPL